MMLKRIPFTDVKVGQVFYYVVGDWGICKFIKIKDGFHVNDKDGYKGDSVWLERGDGDTDFRGHLCSFASPYMDECEEEYSMVEVEDEEG